MGNRKQAGPFREEFETAKSCTANCGQGSDWSAQWVGFIIAPASGDVTFYGKSNKKFIIEIAGKKLFDVGRDLSNFPIFS